MAHTSRRPKIVNSVGRPQRKVKDTLPHDWQDQILRMSAQGMSDVEIRARLCTGGNLKGVFRHDLWDAFISRDEEFSTTIKKGKTLCQAWWEATAREGLHKKYFQTGCWTMNMKNRFGWRDRTEVEGQSLKQIANALQAIRARREAR